MDQASLNVNNFLIQFSVFIPFAPRLVPLQRQWTRLFNQCIPAFIYWQIEMNFLVNKSHFRLRKQSRLNVINVADTSYMNRRVNAMASCTNIIEPDRRLASPTKLLWEMKSLLTATRQKGFPPNHITWFQLKLKPASKHALNGTSTIYK